MASTIGVDTIQNSTSGTTGLTIDTSGDVTESNFCLSWWYKTAVSESISSITLLDDWTEISDAHGFKRIGGAFTVSSGIWTFPRTGVYKIEAQFAFSGSDPTRYASGFISFSNNSGSSFDNLVFYRDLNDSSSSTVYSHITTTRFLNITNTSTHKVKLQFESQAAVALRGSMSETAVVFKRIAPPQ